MPGLHGPANRRRSLPALKELLLVIKYNLEEDYG